MASAPSRKRASTVHVPAARHKKTSPKPQDLDPRVQYITSFWAEVEDPGSGETLYVNPVTGECRRELEPGTYCLPQKPDGIYWEILDEKQGVPYYFHTMSKETTWTRPSNDQGLIIPLTALQESGAARRFSQYLSSVSLPEESDTTNSLSTFQCAESETTISPPQTPTSSASRPSESSPPRTVHYARKRMSKSHTSPDAIAEVAESPSRISEESETTLAHRRSRSWSSQVFKDRSPLSQKKTRAPPAPSALHIPGETTLVPKTVSFDSIKHRRKSSLASLKLSKSAPSSPTRSEPSKVVPPVPPISSSHLGSPQPTTSLSPAPSRASPVHFLNTVAGGKFSPLKWRSSGKSSNESSDELGQLPEPHTLRRLQSRPRPEGSVQTKRLSTGDHRVLPEDLQSQLTSFSIDGFAKKHFAERKSGFFSRKTISVSQLTSWQRTPLDAPLLPIDRKFTSEALAAFRTIQRIMGDRDRSAAISAKGAADMACPEDWITDPFSVLHEPWSNAVAEDARSLVTTGIKTGALRDEIYLQLLKQLTRNPSMHSMLRGWQLLQVLTTSFAPSRDLESQVRHFLQSTVDHPVEGSHILSTVAKHCICRLDLQTSKGPRGRGPGRHEIQIRSMSAFNANFFSYSLEHAQESQSEAHGDVPIPLVVMLLCNSLLSLGALRTEGVFRISADSDALAELKASVDEGALHVDSAFDVHTVASAVKVYFRDLPQPLIPFDFYQECLISASRIDVITRIINKLPLLNRRVLSFLITFLQLFTQPNSVRATRMPSKSLAMVWAPNVLRCESKSMNVAFANAPHEQTFFYTLLMHLRAEDVQLEGFKPRHPYPVPVGPFQFRSPGMPPA